jgi:hypothetical protein
MLPDYEIVLGQGIGKILFGIPKSELTDILGGPDEIEIPEDTEKSDWESLWYKTIKCSFLFDPIFEDRLMEIIVENEYFHIGKKIRVGMGKADLLKLGPELNLGAFRIEEKETEELLSQEFIAYDSVGLLLFMEFGKISAIRICPLRNESGLIIWPSLESIDNP